MAGDEGVGPVPIDQMDAVEQVAMRQAQAHQFADEVPSTWGAAPAPSQNSPADESVQNRANAKRQLAGAQSAGTSLRVDPEHVEDLARFFEEEAQALVDRESQMVALTNIASPGTDPVSQGVARVYGQIAAGDDQAYYENYRKLATVLRDTARSLRDSAKQTRTSDQDAADQFKGDLRA